MSHFQIVHPTGLLYRLVRKMPIFESNSMKFDKHVPVLNVYECMSSYLLL